MPEEWWHTFAQARGVTRSCGVIGLVRSGWRTGLEPGRMNGWSVPLSRALSRTPFVEYTIRRAGRERVSVYTTAMADDDDRSWWNERAVDRAELGCGSCLLEQWRVVGGDSDGDVGPAGHRPALVPVVLTDRVLPLVGCLSGPLEAIATSDRDGRT